VRVAVLAMMIVLALMLVACDDSASGTTVQRPELTLPEDGGSEDGGSGDEAQAEPAPGPEEDPGPAEEPGPSEEPGPAEEPGPSETAAEESGDESDIPIWVWVVLGLVLVGGIAWLAARMGSKSGAGTTERGAVEDWRAAARSAYTDSRWLYDELDASLAFWRGDALYDAQAGTATAELGGAKQARWNQLPARMDAARTSLYRVEASAPDPELVSQSTALLSHLTATRSAVDRLAEAHRDRRAAEAGAAGAAQAAREAELRATDALTAARERLSEATLRFSSSL
jgi:hypothetical protein